MLSDSSPADSSPQTVQPFQEGNNTASFQSRSLPRVAVVPAAGYGTRLRPLTDVLPKEILPVGRKTTLDWIVDELQAAGIASVVFVVSPAKERLLRDAYGSRPGLDTRFVIQPHMRGLGDAILQAGPCLAGEPSFLVALGDAVFEEVAPGAISRRLMDATTDAGGNVLGVAVQEVPLERVSRYGIVRPTLPANHYPRFVFDQIVEKPTPSDAPSRYAAAARYVLPQAVLPLLADAAPDAKGEVQLTPALQTLLSRNFQGVAVPLLTSETRHDIGSFDSYFRAFCTFALSDPELGANLKTSLRGMLDVPCAQEQPSRDAVAAKEG